MKPMAGLFRVLLLLSLAASGCARMGAVCEGICIRLDPAAGTVTLIVGEKRGQTGYDQLPPLTFSLPADKRAMGPLPEAGLLLKADMDRKELLVFNPATGGIETVRPLAVKRLTASESAGSGVLKVDPQTRTVTVFVPPLNNGVEFVLSEEDMARPAESWKMGDVVRIYYQKPGESLRMMNVTKTQI